MWPCLRAAFKLPAAKQPSCPALSPPVLPSTISTSFGWWFHCPMPTNPSRYWKKFKNTPNKIIIIIIIIKPNKQIQLLWSELTFCAECVFTSKFFCSLRDNSIRWRIPVPHSSIPGWFCLQRHSSFYFSNAVFLCVLPLFYTLISRPDLSFVYILIYVCGGGGDGEADIALCPTTLPSLIVWFHLSWLTCSCRPHKLTCLPSLWTLGLVGRANNTISFCTNYLMPTTGPASQLFSPHSLARTHLETKKKTEGERGISGTSVNASQRNWQGFWNEKSTRKETVKSDVYNNNKKCSFSWFH